MIKLVPLSNRYFKDLYEWEQDEELQRLIGENKKFTFPIFCELWYDIIDECQNCYFIILNNKIPIGFCNICNIDKKNKNAEIGYYIADSKYRGKGLGYQFLVKLLEVVFEIHKLTKVYVKTFSDNSNNIIFLKKLGFKQEGYLRKDKIYRGKYKDIIIFGLLKSEFYNGNTK